MFTLMSDDYQMKIKEIIKRDGRKVLFNKGKIETAIKKSFEAINEYHEDEYYSKITDKVLQETISSIKEIPTVEQIQDLVEETLFKNNDRKAAKAYTLYRAKRNIIREKNTKLMKIYKDITFSDSKNSNIKRENANVNGDTAMGTMLKYGSEGAKQFYEMCILKEEHSHAHKNGDIHIHDLDFLTMTTTCCQIDLISLFKNGFSTGHGALREPNSIASYSALACIAIQSNQNDQHGGQSIPNFDYALAIGVRKTFLKNYRMNLARNCEALFDMKNSVDFINKIQNQLLNNGFYLDMEKYKEYLNAEKELLIDNGYDEMLINKVQSLAYKNAIEDTDKATYQAMEALIHNLNTMHVRHVG